MVNAKQIWFTSDTHFDHRSMVTKGWRPFGSLEEMEEVLIENWNKLVKPGMDIYHLGDFGFKPKRYAEIAAKLNGNIHLIKGNHDPRHSKLEEYGCYASVRDVYALRYEKRYIWLSHYPHRSWPWSCNGSWHLHGHTHGHAEPWGYSMDVGTDCFDFRPVSLEQVIEIFEAEDRPIMDQHDEG